MKQTEKEHINLDFLDIKPVVSIGDSILCEGKIGFRSCYKIGSYPVECLLYGNNNNHQIILKKDSMNYTKGIRLVLSEKIIYKKGINYINIKLL